MTSIEFKWKDGFITVRKNGTYRYTNHLGGPWSSIQKTLDNPSIDRKFKKLLEDHYDQLIAENK